MNKFKEQLLLLHPRVRHRSVGNESVAVGMHSGSVLVLNEVGEYILKQLGNPQKFDDIVFSIFGEFDGVSMEQAEKDVQGFLSELEQQEFLQYQPMAQAKDGEKA